MSTPLISIIVPVYNAERFLPACIDSILSQKNPDFELILVDDGSTDHSGDICEEYSTKDHRIIVIHKQNGGVCSARNCGLKVAQGEWIAFVDADDLVDADYLSMEQIPSDTDVVFKSFYFISEYHHTHSFFPIPEFSAMSNRDDIIRYYIHHRNNALWDKIIRRRLIGANRFDENLRVGEDFLFFLSLFRNVKSVAFSPLGCYRYVMRAGSAITGFDRNQRVKFLLSNMNYIERICGDSDPLLARHIIALSYLPKILRYHKYWYKNIQDDVMGFIHQTRISELRYFSWQQKISCFFTLLRLRFLFMYE